MANHSEVRSCVKVEVAVLGSPSFWWVLWTPSTIKEEDGLPMIVVS